MDVLRAVLVITVNTPHTMLFRLIFILLHHTMDMNESYIPEPVESLQMTV